jgi:Uma2 family endonuclease
VRSPSAEHEEYKELVLRLVQAADRLGIPLETRGSTTFKRRGIAKGVEPDTCFYVARAREVIGKRTIDLETDPPPDIAAEIDIANESLAKLPVYAALGVPELALRWDSLRERNRSTASLPKAASGLA